MVLVPSPLEELHHPLLAQKHIQLFIKRDDLIHPEIMGNKWRKMKYNLEEAKRQGKETILTMGGAYSNHIYATAAAGAEFGFKTHAIIRGQELNEESNSTLKFARSKGMTFTFVDRSYYREIRDDHSLLKNKFPSHYWLPEGGTNDYAIKGCKEIIEEIEINFDVVITPIGTGGTFSGLVVGVKESQHVIGISVLKGDFIKEEVQKILDPYPVNRNIFEINTDYHFGGYGKTTNELVNFVQWFKEYFGVTLDPIYNGKSVFGAWDMIKSGIFTKNIKIILLHTGGLQSD